MGDGRGEALTSILSGVHGGRRYWVTVPQSQATRPYIVMHRVGGVRDYHLKGPSSLVHSRVQVDIYDETYGGAKTVARDVVAAVSGFVGVINGVQIQLITVLNEGDKPANDTGDITNLSCTPIDLMIHHDEYTLR